MLKVRTAHHRQLAAINRKLDRLIATTEANATKQPNHPTSPALVTKQASIQIPTSTWNDHANKLAADCMEYRLADNTPDKPKILRDAYPIAKFLTAANIENVFKALRHKAESYIPF